MLLDKFYTKESVVDSIISTIKNLNFIENTDLIIEPSAGNGSFIKGIISLNCNYKFYDIAPESELITKQDYLEINEKFEFKKIHIIGNPPFGKQSSLAIKFIKKSCEFCDTISFILPKSFKKDSLKKAFKLNFHLIYQEDLPEKSFLVDSVEYNVPCVFQIWEKRKENRIVDEKLYPINFEFVKKTENPTISFRRVGVNAGTISTDLDKSESSHYFIKLNNNFKLPNLKISFDTDNTVGPRSISKQELIKKFNSF